MKRFFLAALMAAAAVTAEADPLLDCALRATWGARGIPQQFAIRNSDVFVADGRGIAVYDVSNEAAARQTAAVTTLSASRGIALTAHHAVITTSGGIELFTIGADGSLARTDSRPASAHHVAVTPDLVVTAADGVELWKISDNRLQQLARATTRNSIDALYTNGGYVYAAEHEVGIRVYDSSAGQLRYLTIAAAPAYSMTRVNTRLFTAGGAAGIYELDVTTAQQPRLVRTFATGIADFRSVAASTTHLFATDTNGILRIYDITGDPTLVATLSEPGNALIVSGPRLYIGGVGRDASNLPLATGAPLRVFDITDSASPRLVAQFSDYAGGITGAATDGIYAYIADAPLMRVIDISGTTPREVATVSYHDGSDRMRISGRWAVPHGRLDAHVVDVGDPARPRYAGVYHTFGNSPSQVSFAGEYMLEANKASGFHVLSLTNPAAPHHNSGLKNDGRGQWFGTTSIPGVAYGFISTGIRVIDLANPAAATEVAFLRFGRLVDAEAALTSKPVLVVLDDTRVRLFDITNPLAPFERGSVEVGNGLDLAVDGAAAYIINSDGVIHRLDVSNPDAPRVTHTASGLLAPTQVAVKNGKVVIADTYRLVVLDDFASADGQALPVQITAATDPAGRFAHLDWSARDGARYELQLSSSSDFSNAETVTVIGGSAVVDLTASTQYVRVRERIGCSVSAWSDLRALAAASTGSVVFETSGQRIVLADGASATTIVGVRNDGTAAAALSLVASPAGSVAPLSPTTVPAGARASVVVTILPVATGDVALSLSGMSGSHVIRVSRVRSSPRASIERDALVLPGVGSLPGLNGTRWRSDVSVVCRSASGCPLDIAYSSATDPASERFVTFSATNGETIVIGDAAALLGGEGTSGVVRISSDHLDRISASAYTYNDAPAGKFGQRIAARRFVMRSPLLLSRTQILLGVAHDDVSRTNIGVHNPTANRVIATVNLFDAAGASVASQPLVIEPFASSSVAAGALTASLPAGYATLDADPRLIAYASRVDQRTGDATFSYASRVSDYASPTMPTHVGSFGIVGTTPGTNGTEWRSAIDLFNPTNRRVELRAIFSPAAAPHHSIAKTISLERSSLLHAEDVRAIFPEILQGSLGSLRVESPTAIVGWGRLYNVGGGGTYGQHIAMRDVSPAAHMSDVFDHAKITPPASPRVPQMFPLSEGIESRTNVTLVETAGMTTLVRLRAYDAAGAPLAIDERILRGFDTLFLNRYLTSIGVEEGERIRLEIERVSGGRIDAFASVVQAETNDAITIPAE